MIRAYPRHALQSCGNTTNKASSFPLQRIQLRTRDGKVLHVVRMLTW